MRLRRGRERAWALASAAGLAVASWAGSAIGAPFELTWSAPEGCPSREAMIDATLERLEESRSDAPPELFVQGTVRRESGGFVVSLALRDAFGRGMGEREVRVERQSCEAVEGMGALVLALMIAVARPNLAPHTESAQEPGTAPPSSEPPSSTPPSSEPPSPPPVRRPGRAATGRELPRSSSEERPLRLLVGAGGTASLGVLPIAGLGFGLRAMVSPRSIVLVGVEGGFDAGASVEARGGEVGFQMFSAAARVGLSALQTPRFELIPNVDLRGGLIRTSARGLRTVESDDRTVVLAGLGVLARAKLGQGFFAEVLPEVAAVFFRRQFQIRGGGPLYDVHRVGAVEARLSLGLGYEFR